MIDTVSHRVYAFERGDDKIQAEWDNLDECLCDICDKVSKMPLVDEKYRGKAPDGAIFARPYASELTSVLVENANPIQNATAF